jgi:hypothetical protein
MEYVTLALIIAALAMLGPMGFGGLLGLGGGGGLFGDPFGSDSRKKANRANEERFHAALREIDTGREEQRKRLGQGRGDLLKALDASKAGYDKAGGLLNAATSGTLLNAAQGAQRAAGGIQAQLLSRGLGGSTAAGNAARGVAADLARTQSGVVQQNAGQQAGLAAQGGESQALILRQLSQQRAQSAEALANWRRMKVNTLTDVQDVASPGWLPQMLGAAGNVAGMLGGLG